MTIHSYSLTDARFERLPGQSADVFAAPLLTQKGDGPMSVGYRRWDPDQALTQKAATDEVLVVLEGSLTVTTLDGARTVTPGDILHLPEGQLVTITAHYAGTTTVAITPAAAERSEASAAA